jgi:hypothetical protein
MQVSLLLYKSNKKQKRKKKRNGKKIKELLNASIDSMAIKWANILLQYRINVILNITT